LRKSLFLSLPENEK